MKRYLVIVTGREKGKYFTLLDGEMEDSGEEVIDDVHKKIKATGHREWKIRNRITNQVDNHLKRVAQKAKEYLNKKHIRVLTGVIIGTHQELGALVKRYITAEIKIPIIGEFIADVDLSTQELLTRAANVAK